MCVFADSLWGWAGKNWERSISRPRWGWKKTPVRRSQGEKEKSGQDHQYQSCRSSCQKTETRKPWCLSFQTTLISTVLPPMQPYCHLAPHIFSSPSVKETTGFSSPKSVKFHWFLSLINVESIIKVQSTTLPFYFYSNLSPSLYYCHSLSCRLLQLPTTAPPYPPPTHFTSNSPEGFM